MKKFLSVLAVIFICLVIAALSVFIVAKTKLTPEAIQKTLNHTAAQYLGRAVSVNNIRITFSGEIHMKGISAEIMPGIEESPLFTADELIVKPRLLPVLFNRFVIKKLSVQTPAVSSALLHGLDPVLPSQVGSAPMKVLFIPDKLMIKKGRIFHGYDTSDTVFENISLKAPDISFIFPFNINLSAGLPGSRQNDVEGAFRISVPGRNARGEIAVEKIPAYFLRDFVRGYGIDIEEGNVSFNSTVSLEQMRTLQLRGDAHIGDFAFTDSRGIALQDIDFSVNFVSDTDIPARESVFSSIRGEVLSQPFSGRGEVRGTTAGNLINFSFQSDRFSPSAVLNTVKHIPSLDPEGIGFRGPVNLSALVKGTLGQRITPTVLIDFLDNQIHYPPLGRLQPSLKGVVNITDEKIFIDNLDLRTRGMSLVLYGDIYNYATWPPDVQVRVVSSRIDFTELFPDREIFEDEDIGPFDLRGLTAGGPINLGNVSFLGIPIQRLQGTYEIKENIFHIKNLTGTIGEGNFRLSLTCDLGVRGLDYHTHLRLNNAPVDTLFNMLYPGLRHFLEGELSGNFALKGDGSTLFRFRENLKADGVFNLTNGVIRNISFPPPVPSIINTSELREVPLTGAGLQLSLRGGFLTVDASLLSPKAEFYPKGVISLDSWMDINAQARVLPEIFIAMGDMSRYLPRENNMIALSFDIRGDLANPNITLDRQSLDYIMQQTLPNIFRDMFSDRKEAVSEEMFDQLLEKLEEEMTQEQE